MKDFVKWLGVNEKVAKVVVWILMIMVSLIIINSFMESIGLNYYKITYESIKKVSINKILEYLTVYIVTLLNFYSIVLLVFRVKETKRILKYALLYLVLNSILTLYLPKSIMLIFVIGYTTIFSYFFSGKKWRYVLHTIIAFIFTTIIQGIWYLSKIRFIDTLSLNNITKSLLSLDYFIIMAVIILVKEIYLKKRGE